MCSRSTTQSRTHRSPTALPGSWPRRLGPPACRGAVRRSPSASSPPGPSRTLSEKLSAANDFVVRIRRRSGTFLPGNHCAARPPPGVGAGTCSPRSRISADIVLGQLDVDLKKNEITLFSTLLDNIELLGALVTADALHCQKDHAKYLVEQRGAHYLLTVKGDQPTLRKQVAGLPWADFPITHIPASSEHEPPHGGVRPKCAVPTPVSHLAHLLAEYSAAHHPTEDTALDRGP